MYIEKRGKLSARDRVILWAFSEFLLWLGNALKRVDSYEDFAELGPIVEAKMEEFDQKYPELAESNAS